MRQLFDKRKWLAAIISITLIMGILQPCLAETTPNYDQTEVTEEEISDGSAQETADTETDAENSSEDGSEDLEESGQNETSDPEISDNEETGASADAETETDAGDSDTTETTASDDTETENFDNIATEGSDNTQTYAGNAINMDAYIKKASLSYQQGENWIPVDENTKSIPADARFKITLDYSGINTEEALAHGNSVIYKIPELFTDSSIAHNEIQDSDGNVIGTIRADSENHTVTLTFTDEFLKKEEEESQQITGSFSFYATADKDAVKKNPDQTLVIGNQEIHLDFEKDSDARLGTLKLQKSAGVFSQDENGAYLTYTLTVSTGDTPMPEVKVTDLFTVNRNYIDSYLGVSGNETPAAASENPDRIPYEIGDGSGQGNIYIGNRNTDAGTIPDPAGSTYTKPGTLVWNVGNMNANETRSLTYTVRLKPEYIGIQSRGTITNHARSFSKGYPHEDASANFTPSVRAGISKTAGTYEADPSGDGGTITYQVTVSADKNNTYALNNVKINDSLVAGGTAQKYYTSLKYVKDSFALYEGNSVNEANRQDIPANPHPGKSNPALTETEQRVQFDMYVGTLKPGEQKTLTYKIHVKENIFAIGNDAINIGNQAGLYSDDTVYGGNYRFGTSKVTKNIGKKVWDRKLQSKKTDQDINVSIPAGEKIYEKDQDSWKEESSSDRKFTVPSGSYRYQVVVNEAGNWDVSSSVFGDALKNDYLAYKGYLKLDYYETGLSGQPASDEEAVKQLEKELPDDTLWVNIDELKNFSFSPEDLKLAGKKGAFILTYYAVPRNTEDVSEVSSGNSFELSGTATGPGGKQVEISGVRVSTSVVIEGGNKLEASKSGWYFDHNRTSSGDWRTGRLYWVIEVNGSEIPAGTEFRDKPVTGGQSHLIRGTSMTGLYVGKLPSGKSFSEYYGTVKDLETDTSMKKLTGNDKNGEKVPADADYSWTATSDQATISIKKNIKLSEGEHLYIVISTAPGTALAIRDCRVFKNSLEVKDSKAADFIKQNEADIRAVGAGTNFKESAGIYEFDGKTWRIIKTNLSTSYKKLISDSIKEPGTYVEWRIKINYAGDLEGKVSVDDLIPEGMEPVYARYFWINSELFNSPPKVDEIPELEKNDQWKKMVTTGRIDGSNTGNRDYTCTTYYNEQTRQLRFDVSNLQKGGTTADRRSLEIQVVTRLTDTDMMLNGATKNYTNNITVKNDSGKVISTSAATATITKKTITKTKSAVNNSKLPFMITVNSLGEDLIKDSDTVTLVDEISNPLRFDPDSVVIKDKDGKVLTGISPSIEETSTGEKMTLAIPDNQKLTITYEAFLNSAPDTDIAVRNAAYWFGYNKNIAEVKDDHVKYHVDATAGTSKSPVISVKKVDKDAAGKGLKGAQFTLQQTIWDEKTSSWKPAENAPVFSGTTDDDGLVSFGKQQDKLEYNTVYCLRETKAPEGYILNSTPRYYVIAKREEGSGGEYPEELKTWAQHGAEIYYSGSTYKTTVYNRRGTLTVNKCFQDVNGKEESGTDIPDGTCCFGIYSYKENGNYQNEKALQILEITCKKGVLSYKRNGTSVENPEFTQLPAGGSYIVLELDSDQKPITENDTIYTGKTGLSFRVIYPDGIKSVTVPDNGKTETVTIINRQYVNMEPGTGIFTGSVRPYELTLIVLGIMGAFGIFRYRRKRREYGNRS